MQLSTTQFIQNITASGLIAEADVRAFAAEKLALGDAWPDNAATTQELADALIRHNG